MIRKLLDRFSMIFKRGSNVVNLDEKNCDIESEPENSLLCHLSLSYDFLIENNPPKTNSSNKELLFDLGLFDAISRRDENCSIEFYRFRELSNVPKCFVDDKGPNKTEYLFKKNYYDYEQVESLEEKSRVEWTVNFADERLFGFYGSELFAQDEIMVAEMPILACLREYLLENGEYPMIPFTVEYDAKGGKAIATPCLIKNVLRKLNIHTDTIYGNAFKFCTPQEIVSKVECLENPNFENIIAMEAPKYGRGKYDKETISFMLRTAYTAFDAAKRQCNENDEYTVIHTGAWGTGAYGGNREVSALIQIVAANLAKVDTLVYHSLEEESFFEAYRTFRSLSNLNVDEFINRILKKKGYKWGTSNFT